MNDRTYLADSTRKEPMGEFSPAERQEFRDNKDAFKLVFRPVAAEMVREICEQDFPSMSQAQRIDWAAKLVEWSGANEKQQAQQQAGAGFSINITIPNAPDKSLTIEGTATKLPDTSDE